MNRNERRRLAKTTPVDHGMRLNETFLLHQRGDLQAAEAGYRNILTAVPDHPDAVRLLGEVLLDRGKAREAVVVLRRLARLQPDHFGTYYTLGSAFRMTNDLDAAIEAYGATVRWVPGTYDDALRECSRQAEAQGWPVVSDTSWPGYTEIPRDIMQGYRLMADEAADQWAGAPPTHVFVQAGVGAAAASVSVQCRARFAPAPALVVVEPDRAACLLASVRTGALTAVRGALDTIMAGLACGEPSLLAWQELERGAAAFMAIPDAAAVATMRRLAAQGIVAGESGVAGLAGLLLAAANPAARSALGLDAASRVLVFSTEGATDPALYAELVDAA